jgi:hypothetical protein
MLSYYSPGDGVVPEINMFMKSRLSSKLFLSFYSSSSFHPVLLLVHVCSFQKVTDSDSTCFNLIMMFHTLMIIESSSEITGYFMSRGGGGLQSTASK